MGLSTSHAKKKQWAGLGQDIRPEIRALLLSKDVFSYRKRGGDLSYAWTAFVYLDNSIWASCTAIVPMFLKLTVSLENINSRSRLGVEVGTGAVRAIERPSLRC